VGKKLLSDEKGHCTEANVYLAYSNFNFISATLLFIITTLYCAPSPVFLFARSFLNILGTEKNMQNYNVHYKQETNVSL